MTSPAADRLFTQGQQAFVDAVDAMTRSWVGAVRQLSPVHGAPGLGTVSPFAVVPPELVPPELVPPELVDRFFDTGVAVLEAQRAVVHSTVAALRAGFAAAGSPDGPRP